MKGDGVSFETLVRSRSSCRAFLPDEVDEGLLRRVFATAQHTASWCNTQSWHVHLVSRGAIKRLADGLTQHVMKGEESPDFPMPTGYSGVYAERRRASGYGLYSALGIEREDYDARTAQALRNYRFFGAPHVAVISTDAEQGVYGAVDCGGYVANLLNAAHEHGLGAVAQAAIAMHSDYVAGFLELPVDRRIVCAVSIGHPDPDHPANRFRTERADVDQVVTRLDD
jgi:nitroreductase